MKHILLLGEAMTTKDLAHIHIQNQFAWTENYGKNLDALWDQLTSITDQTVISLTNESLLYKNLGLYGEALINTIIEASNENALIQIAFNQKEVR